MRLREILMISALFFGGAGLVACDKTTSTTTDTAKAKSPEDSTDTTGAAKSADLDKELPKSADAAKMPFEATGPVAVIDGEEIPAARFNAEVEKMVKVTQGRVPPQMLQFYKKQILYRLVDENLLNKQVAAKKITLSEDELSKEFEVLKKRFPDEAQFAQFKDRMGVDDAQLREDMRTQATHKKFLETEHDVAVSDKDIEEYYKENVDRFKQEEEVKASHILLKVEKTADDKTVKEIEKKAREIAKKAKAKDADFAALAKEFSEGPSAPKGGDLGFFPRKRMVPPFSEAAFKLKQGEVSDPVRTTFGWHVIKVVERKEARVQPMDEVKDKVQEMLYSKKMRETLTKVMADLKKDAKIEYKEDNIKMNIEVPKTPQGMPGMPGMPPGMGGKGGHGHAHGDGDGHDHAHGGTPNPKIQLQQPSGGKLPKLNVNPKLKMAPKLELKESAEGK